MSSFGKMSNSRRSKLLLMQSLLLLLLFALSHSNGRETTSRAEQSCIASCLANQNIANFTLFPSNFYNANPLFYYDVLDFSIQNLRFTNSSTPKPVAIVMPESKSQLVETVLCSRECSLGIRVRCGGHSYEGTSSFADDGVPFVIIDLMNLDHVSLDMERHVAWVEGGATLGQTYYAISQASKRFGFSAGSCPTVGIGGHIAGGGFGLISRKYGLAADNVVDAILVDADGNLLDRKAMGDEVFWAIRGGGGGVWGIVYAWKIKLLPVPEVVTSFVASRPDTKYKVAHLVYKWQLVAPMLPENFYLSCFVGAGLPETTDSGISATFKGFYLGTKKEASFIINKVFYDLKLKDDECKEMNWIDSIVYFSGLGPTRSSVTYLTDRFNYDKKFFKAKSDYVKTIIPRNGIISMIKILEKEPKGYVILDPYGGIMQNISSESIAFPHRNGNLFTIQYLVEWHEKDNEKSKEYMDWIREFYNAMTCYVSKSPRAAYINYIDLDLGEMDGLILPGSNPSTDAVERARAWGEKYFLSNYDRLVRAKTLIDPKNIFRHQQGIPPNPLPIEKA